MSLAGRIFRRLTGRPAPSAISYGVDLSSELPFLREQIRANASAVPVRVTGPNLLDNFTNETQEMRVAYRRALAEPSVKAALLGKIAAVMALGLQVKPAADTPLDQEVTDFVRHALTRCQGGLPGLIWSILSGGLIDGFSVCEKVWREEDRGRFKGKKTLLALKAKDTRYIQYELDPYRNVTGVFGMRGNGGERFDPSDFVLFRYMALFESPFGLSDLRAAYRAAEMIPAILRLRMIFLDKLTGPFIHGKTDDPAMVESMKKELAAARAGGFIVTSRNDDIVCIDLAMRGTSEFLVAIKDLREECAIGITGAFLHMLTGDGQSGQRGNSQVQQDTVDLFIWMLAVLVAACFQEQLVEDLVDPNYGTAIDLPTVTLEAPNPEAIVAELAIDESLHAMGVPLSKKELYERTQRRPPDPNDPDDALDNSSGPNPFAIPPELPPGMPGAPPKPPGPGGAPPGGKGGGAKGLIPGGGNPAQAAASRMTKRAAGPAAYAEWVASQHPRAVDGEFGSGAGGDKTHTVILPRNQRKLTTGQVEAALGQMGYKVSDRRYDLATKQSLLEVAKPDGTKAWTSIDDVAELLYRSAAGGDRRRVR